MYFEQAHRSTVQREPPVWEVDLQPSRCGDTSLPYRKTLSMHCFPVRGNAALNVNAFFAHLMAKRAALCLPSPGFVTNPDSPLVARNNIASGW